ncbi:T9SS type B sorting domain-containing protein [Flavobacterium hauense]
MHKKITLTKKTALIIALIVSLINTLSAQVVYQHNFGTGTINSYPYTVAPNTINPNLSNSAWTNEAGTWINYNGSTGVALGLYNFTGTTSVTLSFTVAPGKQLSIDSYSFWRQRSPSGGQNWSMAINGTNVGSGTIPSTGTATGTLPVTNPVAALTGTVNIVMTLSGGTGGGTFRVDDFTLNGTVTNSCVAPVITSLNPASGPINTLVTINGSGFQNGTGTSAVKFNGVDAVYTVVSDNVITAIIPAAATTGAVTVTTNSCPGNGPSFTLINNNCTITLPPTDLYISELYDQESGSGGMIEIYNPTASTINLSGYTLQRFGDNPNTPTNILNLTGTLGSEMIYLVACNAPNPSICVAPSASATLGSGFNEDDKFELLKNGTVIDRIMTPPAKGFTQIRKPNAIAPTTTYNVNDWNITQHPADQPGVNLPNNFCQDLGNHIVDPIPGGTPPTVTQPASVSVCENGTTTFSVTLSDPTGFTYQWKVLNSAGNWVNIANNANYSGVTTATLTLNSVPASFSGNQYYCEMVSGTCTLISNAARLTVTPQPVVATVTTGQPTCTVATGSIIVLTPIATGITYSLDGTTYQSTTTFANLIPGIYTVTVKNSTGCTSVTAPITINQAPVTPAVATVTTVQPTCTVATGSIIVLTPIAAGITYSLDGTTYQAATTFANLMPGTYTVTVKNSAGCTSVTAPITINQSPVTPAVATVTTVQPTCTTPTGSITVISPTAANLTYSINGTTYQAATTFANLVPGTYTVTVRNTDGCTSVTAPITINAVPGAPAVASVTTIDPTCALPTGSITITSPLAADLTYSINGITFQTETTFANLIAGTYTVTVKNAAGCTSVTAPVTINPAPGAPAVASITTLQPTCTVPTGSIIVTSPLAADLTYSIDGATFQPETTFANLAPGIYIVTVKNAAGCTSATTPITINTVPVAPAVATATPVQPSCSTPTGSIIITAPIAADLTYSIDGTTFQTETTFANLASGSYTITVKNDAGCTSVTLPIILNTVPNAPAVAAVTTIDPTCAVQTGSITITSPLAADLTYSINGTNFQSAATFSNLVSGTYFVTVKNADGCTSVTSAIVINPVTGGPAIASVTTIQPTCALPTGSITVTAPVAADLTYSIDGTNFQAGTIFTNLAPGSYTVTVKSTAGCTSTTSAIIINTVPNQPQISVSQGCDDNNYIVEVLPLDNSFDISTATFEWKNAQGTTIGNDQNTFNVTQYQSNNSGTQDFPLQFTVTVTNAQGCDNTQSVSVDSYFCTIPRGISPDNDGLNDTFNLTGLNVTKLIIFNRYGHEVYSKNNYTNEWHGQSKQDTDLPTGTYYYVIESDNNQQTGWVYLNRRD